MLFLDSLPWARYHLFEAAIAAYVFGFVESRDPKSTAVAASIHGDEGEKRAADGNAARLRRCGSFSEGPFSNLLLRLKVNQSTAKVTLHLMGGVL